MITEEMWDRARRKAYPNAIHYVYVSQRKEDAFTLATWGPPNPPFVRDLTLEQIKKFGMSLEEAVKDLAEHWINYTVTATDDDPSFDDGRQSGVRECGDKLAEILKDRGLL